jgi:cytochrome c-type biogenesis protein CcmH
MRFVSALVLAVAMFAAAPNDSQARAARWKQRLLAPCCWSEAVAQHNSPVAAEIRAETDKLIAAGASDSEIEARFTAQYGTRILTEPPGMQGVVLRLVPTVVLALGLLWVLLILRRWSQHDSSESCRSQVIVNESTLPADAETVT